MCFLTGLSAVVDLVFRSVWKISRQTAIAGGGGNGIVPKGPKEGAYSREEAEGSEMRLLEGRMSKIHRLGHLGKLRKEKGGGGGGRLIDGAGLSALMS